MKLDIEMTDNEREAYLAEQRTARVATIGEDGIPHVVPLWFVWVDGAMFLNSTLGNVTVDNMLAGRPVAATVDDGDTYDVLRGVVLTGAVTKAEGDPRVEAADRAWSDKYMAGNPTPYAKWKSRLWMRLDASKVTSWDFRKIPEARAKQRLLDEGQE